MYMYSKFKAPQLTMSYSENGPNHAHYTLGNVDIIIKFLQNPQKKWTPWKFPAIIICSLIIIYIVYHTHAPIILTCSMSSSLECALASSLAGWVVCSSTVTSAPSSHSETESVQTRPSQRSVNSDLPRCSPRDSEGLALAVGRRCATCLGISPLTFRCSWALLCRE